MCWRSLAVVVVVSTTRPILAAVVVQGKCLSLRSIFSLARTRSLSALAVVAVATVVSLFLGRLVHLLAVVMVEAVKVGLAVAHLPRKLASLLVAVLGLWTQASRVATIRLMERAQVVAGLVVSVQVSRQARQAAQAAQDTMRLHGAAKARARPVLLAAAAVVVRCKGLALMAVRLAGILLAVLAQ